MPLVYMNSWASLALRAAALAGFGVALLGGDHGATLGACALLLVANAAHPLSVSLRLGGKAAGLLSLAEGAIALSLAAMLALAAARDAATAAHAAALAAPLAVGLALVALASGAVQHERLRREARGRWPQWPIVIAAGSAGVALVAALHAHAIAEGAAVPGLAVAAFALAAWITHCALRLRRVRRTAMRARQRDWALGLPRRGNAASPSAPPSGPARSTTARRLRPATQWSW